MAAITTWSAESHERYARLIADWRSRSKLGMGNSAAVSHPNGSLSINDVLLACIEFARGYYT